MFISPTREYSVWTSTNRSTKKVTSFAVSDRQNGEEEADYPDIVVFPVCQRYTEEEQRARAQQFCNYINGLRNEIKEIVDSTPYGL